jgi:hypothetical protein
MLAAVAHSLQAFNCLGKSYLELEGSQPQLNIVRPLLTNHDPS